MAAALSSSSSTSSIHICGADLSSLNNGDGADDAVCIRRLERNTPSVATEAAGRLSAAAESPAAASAALTLAKTNSVIPGPSAATDDGDAVDGIDPGEVSLHGTAAPVVSRDGDPGVAAAVVSALARGTLPVAAAAEVKVKESVDGRDALSPATIMCNKTKRNSMQDCARGSDRPPKKPKVECKKEDEADAERGGAEGGCEGEIADNLVPSRGLGDNLRAGRKDRREFTASEKLRILSIMDAASVSGRKFREKHGVSKSSLHRWRQQRTRLEEMVKGEGSGDRKRDSRDLLLKIKVGLRRFAEANAAMGLEDRLAITAPLIIVQAGRIRDWLLRRHEWLAKASERRSHSNEAARAGEGVSLSSQKDASTDSALDLALFSGGDAIPALTEEEYEAMKSFKVTKSWAGRVASSMGLLKHPRSKIKPKKRHQRNEGKAVEADTSPSCVKETTSAGAAASVAASLEWAKLNTLRFLSESEPMPAAAKPKKDRREFSAWDKLLILKEMEEGAKMESICAKYHTSKSSVFRWKIQRKSGKLDEMVKDWGVGSRKRIVEDKLLKVKVDLRKFIESCGEDDGLVHVAILQQRAQLTRDTLLLRHIADPSKGILTKEEAAALRTFKASKGWVKKVVAGFGGRLAAVAVGPISDAGDNKSQAMAEGGEMGVGVTPEGVHVAYEEGKCDEMPMVDGEDGILGTVAANEKAKHGTKQANPCLVEDSSPVVADGTTLFNGRMLMGGREALAHAPPPGAVMEGHMAGKGPNHNYRGIEELAWRDAEARVGAFANDPTKEVEEQLAIQGVGSFVDF